ncbi:MAG: hypothetical protein ABUL62_02365 [Myxococcales bacterium]
MNPVWAFAPHRWVCVRALTLSALVFAVGCDDGDAVHGFAVDGSAAASGTTSTGGAGAGAPSQAGAGAAMPVAGAGGSADSGGSEAGAGGVTPGDAGAGGDSDAGAAGQPGQATSCETGGALFLAGNYVDTAFNRLLLRSAAKAPTFALVPSGAANPSRPPQLFAVERLCAPGGALIATDESSSYRVDFTQSGLKFAVCISAPVPTLAAALALPAADSSRLSDTGCAGKPFTVYTAEAP